MTKLEECARAAVRNLREQEDNGSLAIDGVELVRAVLEALREPTMEMVDAGRVAWLDSATEYNRVDVSNSAAWEAMIGAILSEQEKG